MQKTRKDYEEMVKGPGKFEGESPWGPYFYEMWMDGSSDYDWEDSDGTLLSKFYITEEDKELFQELSEDVIAVCWEDNNGFWYCETFKTDQIPED